MAATILDSKRAVEASKLVVNVFVEVKLRTTSRPKKNVSQSRYQNRLRTVACAPRPMNGGAGSNSGGD